MSSLKDKVLDGHVPTVVEATIAGAVQVADELGYYPEDYAKNGEMRKAARGEVKPEKDKLKESDIAQAKGLAEMKTPEIAAAGITYSDSDSYNISGMAMPTSGIEGKFVKSLSAPKQNDGWSMSAYTQPPHSLGGPMSKPKK